METFLKIKEDIKRNIVVKQSKGKACRITVMKKENKKHNREGIFSHQNARFHNEKYKFI